MALGIYIGVNGNAQKVKRLFIGVATKAQLVRKAYIGIGGIARLFWDVTGFERTLAPPLSSARHSLAATTVGSYALFGGGRSSSTTTFAYMSAYNASLTCSTPTALS